MDLLLLSNSRTPDGGYLTHAREALREVCGGRRRALFLPFAGVRADWDDYTAMVAGVFAELGMELQGLHRMPDPVASVAEAEVIVVGGGNSFALLSHCRRLGLLPAVAERVRGGTPYLGWSAGSNLACPGIHTTNDMPIVDPGGLEALGLIPFQINPHYTNALPAGHQGETRNERLAEFLSVNPERAVLGLPEGDWLRVQNGVATLHGERPALLFRAGQGPQELVEGARLPA